TLKILIINPPRVNGYPVVREERYEHKDVGSVYPPLSLLYIASSLEEQGFKPILIDANGFDISWNELTAKIDTLRSDIVITRCGFDTQKEDLKVLEYVKTKFKSITVLRNKIISDVDNLKKELLRKNKYIDIFIDDEPDMVIPDLIKILQKKGLKGIKKAKGISFLLKNKMISTGPVKPKDIDTIPFPAYHLLPSLKVYHTGILNGPFATVITSRGCPFHCTFCAYARMGCRFRKPESVIKELKILKKIHHIKSVLFFDDLVGLKKGYFERICELLIQERLDLKWVACTRANLLNERMVDLMKQAGCVEVPIGIESGSVSVLEKTKKGVTLDDIRKAAILLKTHGILFYGLVIIGLPGETRKTVKETIQFIKEIDPFYTQFCFATPFPNTDIYRYYKNNELLLTEDYSQYTPISSVPVIRTKELSGNDLVELKNYAYRKLVLRPGYLLKKIRLFDWKWNIQGFIRILGVIGRIIKKKMIR
ncbi:MAG: radical SAM protein, partial [Spirochaetes bacterium]|nr:radical SAM protein [Spirochaetota bacterium]